LGTEDLIGYIGGAIVACSFFPQILRVIKLKRASDISPFFTLLMLIGCMLWTVYGFSLKLLPMMVLSVINTTQVALLMILRYMYSRTQQKKVISDQLASNIAYTTVFETNQEWVEDTKHKIDKVLN
jgi:MtN3 and saliva related transmembrane protein